MVAQLVKNPPVMQETPVQFLGWEYPLRKDKLPIPLLLGSPCGSDSKESACNVGNLSLIPGLGRYPGKGQGTTLVYLCGDSPWAEEPEGRSPLPEESCRLQNEPD